MATEPHESLPEDLEAVRDSLIAWYRDEHRAFPWRETDDPYEILVSEVMSQQTQLERIIEPWQKFVDRWPTAQSLAATDRADVVAFWSAHDLGYNNRAKYLHEAATQVVDEFDGTLPESPESLQELMGVGPYTANAVASFAFNAGNAVVDTNVKRILYRAFDVPDDRDAFEDAADELMPTGDSRVWNNAIMELGGVACTKTPSCDEGECPWRECCSAYRSGDFSAPDVPAQTSFDGSRRQMRGRVIDVLASHGPQTLDELGPRIRVDYQSGDSPPEADPETLDGKSAGRDWLVGLLEDLESDGLVTLSAKEPAGGDGALVAELRR